MNIYELLKKRQELSEEIQNLNDQIKQDTYSFKFCKSSGWITDHTLAEALKDMVTQHRLNIIGELNAIDAVIKSINHLVSGAMPEKVKV